MAKFNQRETQTNMYMYVTILLRVGFLFVIWITDKNRKERWSNVHIFIESETKHVRLSCLSKLFVYFCIRKEHIVKSDSELK